MTRDNDTPDTVTEPAGALEAADVADGFDDVDEWLARFYITPAEADAIRADRAGEVSA